MYTYACVNMFLDIVGQFSAAVNYLCIDWLVSMSHVCVSSVASLYLQRVSGDEHQLKWVIICVSSSTDTVPGHTIYTLVICINFIVLI